MGKIQEFVEKKKAQLAAYTEKKKLATQVKEEKRAQRLEHEAEYQKKIRGRLERQAAARKEIAKTQAVRESARGPSTFSKVQDFATKIGQPSGAGDIFGDMGLGPAPSKSKSGTKSQPRNDLGMGNMFGGGGMFGPAPRSPTTKKHKKKRTSRKSKSKAGKTITIKVG